jgi:hypothetical protein
MAAGGSGLAARDRTGFLSIRAYYLAASDLLVAATGLDRQADAAFLGAAGDFGFAFCAHYRPVDGPPAI